jgi:enamine deaminase RidA (YjgF/YER057c/UK114 family)
MSAARNAHGKDLMRATLALSLAALAACMPPRPPGGPNGPAAPAAPAVDPAAFAPKGFSPKGVPRLGGFSAAVRAGGVVYLSTQLPAPMPDLPPSRELLLQQADEVFRNLSRATLGAGAFPADLARITLYTRGVNDEDLDALRRVVARWFPTEDPPALSIVIVPDLPIPGALLAADGVVALRPPKR